MEMLRRMQTRSSFWSSVQQLFDDPMLHPALLAIAGPLVREEQGKHLQHAQDTLN